MCEGGGRSGGLCCWLGGGDAGGGRERPWLLQVGGSHELYIERRLGGLRIDSGICRVLKSKRLGSATSMMKKRGEVRKLFLRSPSLHNTVGELSINVQLGQVTLMCLNR